MYSVLQRYTFDPQVSGILKCQIKQAFVPPLRQLSTFVAYYWLDSGDGTGLSLCVFEDQAGADAGLQLAADFVQQHLAALVGQPEIIRGEVKAYANCGL